MNIQEQYEAETRKSATYLGGGSTWHTLRYVRWLESRLAEEIECGHRDCKPGNCASSGTDCPARPVEDHDITDGYHANKEAAKKACERYSRATERLRERLGVWEENEDSCAATFIYARYRDESGKIVGYCHY